MAEKVERNKFWNIFYSPLSLIILSVLFLLIARSSWRVYVREFSSEQERLKKEQDLALVNERIAVLQKQIQELKTQKGIEDEIRSKFNVARQNEGVAVIINGSNTPSEEGTTTSDRTWWQKFIEIF